MYTIKKNQRPEGPESRLAFDCQQWNGQSTKIKNIVCLLKFQGIADMMHERLNMHEKRNLVFVPKALHCT